MVLTVLVGDCRCRVPVQKQGEERDSPQHVLAGSHKEDGRGGLLIKVKGYVGTMTTVSCNTGTRTVLTWDIPCASRDKCYINAVYLWAYCAPDASIRESDDHAYQMGSI